MQSLCSELSDRLRQALDEEHNVVDMGTVLEVIAALERTPVTKEVLEVTRLGRLVNELRRKTSNDALARRAKDLVRRWRELVLPGAHATPQPPVTDSAPSTLNGAGAQSPALRSLRPQSPVRARGLVPQSPLLRSTCLSGVSSPLSAHSEQSRSPVVSPRKVLVAGSQNHLPEAVPRTHSSNKRLRKDEGATAEKEAASRKLPRLNGETTCGSASAANSQVPSPTLKERNPELEEPAPPVVEGGIAKKRGRKKGSKSAKKQLSAEDSVKEKLASISRHTKLKTTQELLADLQARGSKSNANLLPSHSVAPPTIDVVLRTKSEADLSTRGPSVAGDGQERRPAQLPVSRPVPGGVPPGRVRSPQDLSVEEILAKLPPLQPGTITWSDDEDEGDVEEIDTQPRVVTDEDVERLHARCVEGLNGNFQPNPLSTAGGAGVFADTSGSRSCKDEVNFASVVGLRRSLDNRGDEVFREWHEMLARPSSDGQILHILPYVIID